MKTKKATKVILMTLCLSTMAYSDSNFELLRSQIVSGGQQLNSASMQLQHSFGRSTLHTSSAANFSLQGGLWPANATDIIFNNGFES